MHKIYSSPTLFEVHNIKNVLEGEGIACEVRGEFRKAASGDLPPIETWAELWLVDPANLERAQSILRQYENLVAESWVCTQCEEPSPGNFWHCWNCKAPRPETLSSS